MAICMRHVTPQAWCHDCPLSAYVEPPTAHDALAARIAGLEASVNEKVVTIAGLNRLLEQRNVWVDKLQGSEAALEARCANLAEALRHALADSDPKAMSTWDQQERRREARALLEQP